MASRPDTIPNRRTLIDRRALVDALAEGLAGVSGFEARRAEAAARGKLRGYGLSVYQEPDGYYESHVGAVFDADGILTLATSATANGQGHLTTFKQVVSQQLGLSAERIRYVSGDSDKVGVGVGSVGSCETTVTGTAIVHCARIIIEKGRLIAGHLLEAPASDVEFEVTDAGGSFVIAGTDLATGTHDRVRLDRGRIVECAAPAECPKTNRRFMSTPKDAAFFSTHWQASFTSSVPAGYGAEGALRYSMLMPTMPCRANQMETFE